MSFCAVNDNKTRKFQVIWDLGRRCTYKCSYCPPHRRNNWSPIADFEELKTTAHKIDRYGKLLNKYRVNEFHTGISFTGGEPTVNPIFFDFLEYMTEHLPDLNKSLTTNGCYSEKRCQKVIKHANYCTLSYHCESSDKNKELVRNNIMLMKEANFGFKVNVMMHADETYFQECVDLIAWLEKHDINFIPRVIGDSEDIKQGVLTKNAHTYSAEQLAWYKNYWKAKKQKVSDSVKIKNENENKVIDDSEEKDKKAHSKIKIVDKKESKKEKKGLLGQSLGRPCCGGREIEVQYEDNWEKAKFVPKTNFKDWSCMVNWYFLYVHQEIDKIWFHQTCQVNLEGNIAPISNISNFDHFIDELEQKLATGKMPIMKCPKSYCGCGLCTPKAKEGSLAREIFSKHVKNVKPYTTPKRHYYDLPDLPITLKSSVNEFDTNNSHLQPKGL